MFDASKTSPHCTVATSLAVLVLLSLACGGTFEPTPDIPEHVEYDTVCIKYGNAGECQADEMASADMMQQALVGEASTLAKFTYETVFTTNTILRDQFKLVSEIKSFPPTQAEEGKWIWESEQPRKNRYFRFEIHEHTKATNDPFVKSAYRYLFYLGFSKSDHELYYSAEFYQFDKKADLPAQQGYGVVRFFFDNIKKYGEDVPDGRLRIAFRSRNRVRQVRVAFNRVRVKAAKDYLSALYEYIQLPAGQGKLTYFGTGDFSEDGPPYESLGAQAAWTKDLSGHIAARMSGGSLEIPELLVRECWDNMGITTYARSMPTVPNYDGGMLEDCAIPLQTIELSPPQPQDPGDADPEVPKEHPDE